MTTIAEAATEPAGSSTAAPAKPAAGKQEPKAGSGVPKGGPVVEAKAPSARTKQARTSPDQPTGSKDGAKPKVTAPAVITKAEMILKLLRRKKGTTISELQDATGWQAHSVRGFLSASVKKRMGLDVKSEAGGDGVRRYMIAS